jgi:hypothetical protein
MEDSRVARKLSAFSRQLSAKKSAFFLIFLLIAEG